VNGSTQQHVGILAGIVQQPIAAVHGSHKQHGNGQQGIGKKQQHGNGILNHWYDGWCERWMDVNVFSAVVPGHQGILLP
jgi:hypothetical protein